MDSPPAPRPHDLRVDAPVPERDPRRWLILAVMSLGTLIVFLDLTVVNTALPAISVDLGASTSQLQWVVDAYVLVLAGLLILAGSTGDRFGRKRWMSRGLLLLLAGSVVAALAGSVPMLVTGRALQGLGAAFVLPATLSIVTNTFDRAERGTAIAVWTSVGGIGIGFGPAIGGYLVERIDWPAAFWVHVPIIALALIGQAIVPESRNEQSVGFDVAGAVTATLGITVLVFGVIQGNEAGWTSPLIVGSFVAAAALLAAFVRIERRSAFPMLPLQLFHQRDFTGAVAVITLMFFAGPGSFFFLTQFFQIVQGRGPLEAGLLILPNVVTIVLASAISPRLTDLLGPRWVVIIAVSIMTLSMVLLTQIAIDWSTITEVWVIMVLGFGFGLGMPPLTDTIMAAVPVEDAGVGSAVNDVSRELGTALGIAVVGSVINGIYRENVDERLTGQVPAATVEAAREGLGILTTSLPSLTPDVSAAAFDGASAAFVDAMNTGFLLTAGVMATGVLVAWLLPNRARSLQVERTTVRPDQAAQHAGEAVGEPMPDRVLSGV